MFDGKAFGEEMVTIVKGYVDRATAQLFARIEELEKREPVKGDPGKDADPVLIERLVADAVIAAVANIPVPADGKSVEPSDVRDMIHAEIASAMAAIPAVEAPAPIEPDMEAIAAIIERAVGTRFEGIRQPEDGKSLTAADVTPMIENLVAKSVAAIPTPKDGIGAAGALIDRAGDLVLTLSNGDTRNLGPVVGRDADLVAIERRIDEAVAQISLPKDGQDALGFDDMQFEHDGERGFTLKFVRDELVKTFQFHIPATIYRGVWREGSHKKGDAVTWAGSLWIAQKDTDAKPDTGDGWQLAVKRGRDGKDTAPR